MLDLGPRARVAFALCFFAAELALIVSAPWRVDSVFESRAASPAWAARREAIWS